MTVVVTPVLVEFDGDGVATVFGDLPYPALDGVLVYVGGVLDPTATLSTDKKQIQLASAPASGAKISVLRDTVIGQTGDFNDLKKLPGATIEAQLDRLTYIAQEHDDNFGRTLMAPPGQVAFELPYGQDVSGKILMGTAENEFGLVGAKSVITMSGKGDVFETYVHLRALADADVIYAHLRGGVSVGDGYQGTFSTDDTAGYVAADDNGYDRIVDSLGRLFTRDTPEYTREAPPGPTLVLMFDDGYQNNLTVAASIAAEFGHAFTVGVEVERVGKGNYAGISGQPVLTAQDLRTLVEKYGCEIVNHAALPDLAATESVMVADAQAENLLLRQLMTGEKRVSGQNIIDGTITHPEYANYPVAGAVYRGGFRSATSDLAYYYTYDKVRSINGTLGFSGDHLYSTDVDGPKPMHWTALTCDPNNDPARLQKILSYVRSLSGTDTGIIYGHFTPEDADVADAGTTPYVSASDFRAICQAAYDAGVRIVPWRNLGPCNLMHDPTLQNGNVHTLQGIGGANDIAARTANNTLNGAATKVELYAEGYRTGNNRPSLTTEPFSVRPFTRYTAHIRYQIQTELVLNGGSGNVNHGISIDHETRQNDTSGILNGTSDDYSSGSNVAGYARKYQVTAGYEEIEFEFVTGYGYAATLAISLNQCTGTVHIGHIRISKGESAIRTPPTGIGTHNTSIYDTITLTAPNTTTSRKWDWDLSASPTITTTVTDVDFAFADSADVPTPANGDTCFILTPGASAFAGESGISTYDGTNWSAGVAVTREIVKAGNAEGTLNQYFWCQKTLGGVAEYKRIGGAINAEEPLVHNSSNGVYLIYNESGLESGAFTWIARVVEG